MAGNDSGRAGSCEPVRAEPPGPAAITHSPSSPNSAPGTSPAQGAWSHWFLASGSTTAETISHVRTLALIATTMCLLVLPKEQGQCILLGRSLGSQQDTLTLFSQDGVAEAPASVGEGEGPPSG